MDVGSMGPMNGVISSAAGAPLSQTSGSENERAKKDSNVRQREVDSEKKTEKSAGVGQTEEDRGASERDADGRRFWEKAAEPNQDGDPGSSQTSKQVKDPSGDSGGALDLTG
jgi:hypothetical protein